MIAAGICLAGRAIIFGFSDVSWSDIAATVANRILMGFAIGISSWRLPYLLHGALIGFLISISVSIGFLPGDLLGFGLYTTAGIGYGMLIEWLATDLADFPMRITD
jgi:hypothetical protein